MIRRLRAALLRVLPSGTTLQRDRGAGLFVAHGRIEAPDGWQAVTRGAMTVLTPEPETLRALWETLPPPRSDLARSCVRTKDDPITDEALACFLEGLKRLESCTPSERRQYEKRVRMLAALNLRTGKGSAYPSAVLLEGIGEKR